MVNDEPKTMMTSESSNSSVENTETQNNSTSSTEKHEVVNYLKQDIINADKCLKRGIKPSKLLVEAEQKCRILELYFKFLGAANPREVTPYYDAFLEVQSKLGGTK